MIDTQQLIEQHTLNADEIQTVFDRQLQQAGEHDCFLFSSLRTWQAIPNPFEGSKTNTPEERQAALEAQGYTYVQGSNCYKRTDAAKLPYPFLVNYSIGTDNYAVFCLDFPALIGLTR